MGDFDRCIETILTEEGGLSNHPADPGGLTKYGISQRSYPELNIALLTLEQAKALYLHDYWQPIKGDLLPAGLDLLLLDCAINQGTHTAIFTLQRTLGINTDGVIGPMTLNSAMRAMPVLLDSFAAERALRYELNRHEAVFGRGWYHRLFRIHRMAWQFALEPIA
jgi:lysozyme family protein